MLPNKDKIACESNYDCMSRRQSCARVNTKNLNMDPDAELKFKQTYFNSANVYLFNEMKWKIMDIVVDAF